jgi:hypothetical protein
MEGARRGGGARRFRVRAECEDVSEVKRRRDVAVGVDVKTVTLDVFVMATNGVPAASDFIVQRDIADAKERYAQADVRIEIGQVTQVEMPAGIATNWYVGFYLTPAPTYRLSSDAKLILVVSKEEFDAINLVRNAFHGEWNYEIRPRKNEHVIS